MASDVMTLFNMPSQQELGQRYLESQMVSPAQMGNQGLLQQVVSMGANAGAGIGYGAGRLFGGGTPEQVRAKGIEEAMRTVQGMGFTSDAEMYAALSKELGARGLTQDAFMANKEARAAMRDEQVVKKGGLDIETATVQLQKAKEDMLTLEEQIAQEMSFGNEAKVAGLQRQLEAKKRASALVEAQIKAQEATAKAALMNAGANVERASALAGAESYTKPEMERDPILGTPRSIGRYSAKLNQYISNDGMSVFKSRSELLAHDNALRAQQKDSEKLPGATIVKQPQKQWNQY
jgi:hypothetical protein